MTDQLSIALAQINPTVGSIPANIERLRAARAEAAARGADLVVFPELAVSGHPPEDLVLKPFFLDAVETAVRALAEETADGGPALLVGAPWRDQGQRVNAVLLLDKGAVAAARFKVDLPGYGASEDKRLFTPGPLPGPVNVRGVRLGIPIGQDIGTPDVVETLAESGAEILIVPTASPFAADGQDERLQLAVARVLEAGLPMLIVNQVGGQDSFVYDGASFALAADGTLVAQAPSFAEHLLLTRWERGPNDVWLCHEAETIAPLEGPEALYAALTLGLRDFVNKNLFPGVLLDLSGDLGSALVAAIAVDALGADRVHGVTLPSARTPRDRLDDAAETAELLGIRLDSIPIAPAMKAFDAMLTPAFAGREPGLALDALEARARGATLAGLSEMAGAMVLSTADKTDRAVGRAARSGDPCEGYAVLTDLHRTAARALARWRNAHTPAGARGPAGRVVPERALVAGDEPLTADDRLDDVLESLIGQDWALPNIVGRGHAADTVNRVWRALRAAEPARRQTPPGPQVTHRPRNRERRFPITSGFTSLL